MSASCRGQGGSVHSMPEQNHSLQPEPKAESRLSSATIHPPEKPMSQPYTPTARTRVTREPQLGVYDREVAYEILDEGFICHVGFSAEGQTYVIPTSYGRSGDQLYIHGSAASRTLKQLKQGVSVCLTVTLLDGLVLARSVFNHSMNYRSVVSWEPPPRSTIQKRRFKPYVCFPSTSSRAGGTTRVSQTNVNS